MGDIVEAFLMVTLLYTQMSPREKRRKAVLCSLSCSFGLEKNLYYNYNDGGFSADVISDPNEFHFRLKKKEKNNLEWIRFTGSGGFSFNCFPFTSN